MTSQGIDQRALLNASIEYYATQHTTTYSPYDKPWHIKAPRHMVCYGLGLAYRGTNKLEDMRGFGFSFGEKRPATVPLDMEGAKEGSMGAIIVFGAEHAPQVIQMSVLLLPVKTLSPTIQDIYKKNPRQDRAWLLFPLLEDYHKGNVRNDVERAFRQGCLLSGEDPNDYVALFFADNMHTMGELARFLFDFGPNKLQIPSFGAAMKLATYGALTGQRCDAESYVVTGENIEQSLRKVAGVGLIKHKTKYQQFDEYKHSTFLIAAQSTDCPDDSTKNEEITDILEVIERLGWKLPTQQYINFARTKNIWAVTDFFAPKDTVCPVIPVHLEPVGIDPPTTQSSFDVEAFSRTLGQHHSDKCTFVFGFGGNGKSMLLRQVATHLAESDVTPIVVNLTKAEPKKGVAGLKALIQHNEHKIAPYLQWIEQDGHVKDIALLVDGWDDLTPTQRDSWLDILEHASVHHTLIVSRYENKPDTLQKHWQLEPLTEEHITAYLQQHYRHLPQDKLRPFTNRMTLRMAIWTLEVRGSEQDLTITNVMDFITEQLFKRGMERYKASLPVLVDVIPPPNVDEYRHWMAQLSLFWLLNKGYQALTIEQFIQWHQETFKLTETHLIQSSQQDLVKFLAIDTHLLSIEPQTKTISALHNTLLAYFAAQAFDTSVFEDNVNLEEWFERVCTTLNTPSVTVTLDTLYSSHWLDVLEHVFERAWQNSSRRVLVERLLAQAKHKASVETYALDVRLMTILATRTLKTSAKTWWFDLAVDHIERHINYFPTEDLRNISDNLHNQLLSLQRDMDTAPSPPNVTLVATNDDELERLRKVGRIHGRLGQIYDGQYRFREALEHRQLFVETFQRLVNTTATSDDPIQNISDKDELVRAYINLGQTYEGLRQYQQCQHAYEQALAIIEALFEVDNIESKINADDWTRRRATVHGNLGQSHGYLRQFEESIIHHHIELEMFAALAGVSAHPSPEALNDALLDPELNQNHLRSVMIAHSNLGQAYKGLRAFEQALDHLELELILSRFLNTTPQEITADMVRHQSMAHADDWFNLASSHENLGDLYMQCNQFAMALEHLEIACPIRLGLSGLPDSFEREHVLKRLTELEYYSALRNLAIIHGKLSTAYLGCQYIDEALNHVQIELMLEHALFGEVVTKAHLQQPSFKAILAQSPNQSHSLMHAHGRAGQVYTVLQDDRASDHYDIAVFIAEHFYTEHADVGSESSRELASYYIERGRAHKMQAEYEAELATYLKAKTILQTMLGCETWLSIEDIERLPSDQHDTIRQFGILHSEIGENILHTQDAANALEHQQQELLICLWFSGLTSDFNEQDLANLSELQHNDLQNLAIAHSNMGHTHNHLEELDTAIEYHLKELMICRVLAGLPFNFVKRDIQHALTSYREPLSELSMAFSSLGGLYHQQEQHERALGCFWLELAIEQELAGLKGHFDDTDVRALLPHRKKELIHLAMAYHHMGWFFHDYGVYDDSEYAYRASITIERTIAELPENFDEDDVRQRIIETPASKNRLRSLAENYALLGAMFAEAEQYERAHPELLKSYLIAQAYIGDIDTYDDPDLPYDISEMNETRAQAYQSLEYVCMQLGIVTPD